MSRLTHHVISIVIGYDMIKPYKLFLDLTKCHLKVLTVGFLANFHKKETPKFSLNSSICYLESKRLNSRPECENRIKELKSDFGLENFCLKDFWATQASFRFIMVSYNLMSLFRYFALNHHKKATLKTLKVYCFALGDSEVNQAI